MADNGATLAYRGFMHSWPNINQIRTPERKAQTLEAINKGLAEGRVKPKKKK